MLHHDWGGNGDGCVGPSESVRRAANAAVLRVVAGIDGVDDGGAGIAVSRYALGLVPL